MVIEISNNSNILNLKLNLEHDKLILSQYEMKVGAVENTYNIQRLTPYVQADVLDHGGQCNMPTQIRRSTRQIAKALGIKGIV